MDVKDCINYLLTTAQHSVNQYLFQRLVEFDVTPSQYGVLGCLWKTGGACTPKHISDELFLETSTVSGILDRMQKKGLIIRVVNPENRREILVSLTDKGKALEAPVSEVIVDFNHVVSKALAPEDWEPFKNNLRKIAENGFAEIDK